MTHQKVKSNLHKSMGSTRNHRDYLRRLAQRRAKLLLKLEKERKDAENKERKEEA